MRLTENLADAEASLPRRHLLVKRCGHGNAVLKKDRATGAVRGVAVTPALKVGCRSSGQHNSRTRGELRTAGRPYRASDSGRRACHRATEGAGHRYRKNRQGPSRRTAETRWAIHRNRGRIAHNIAVAAVQLRKNLGYAAVEVRRGDSRAGDLNDLWIIRLPVHLIGDVDRLGRMDIRAEGFESKISAGIDGSKCAARRLDRDRNQPCTPCTTGQGEQPNASATQDEDADPLAV